MRIIRRVSQPSVITLRKWVDDFTSERSGDLARIAVLRNDAVPEENKGVVTVELPKEWRACISMDPTGPEHAEWEVKMLLPSEETGMTAREMQALVQGIVTASDLAAYLQARSLDAADVIEF